MLHIRHASVTHCQPSPMCNTPAANESSPTRLWKKLLPIPENSGMGSRKKSFCNKRYLPRYGLANSIFLIIVSPFSCMLQFSWLCYRNLGSENLVLWNLRNMRSNTTTMMEILNPSVRIKDIAFQPTKAEGECFLSLKYIANFSFFPPERRLDSKVFCTFALEHRYRGKPPLKSERRRRCDFCG